MGGVNQLRGVLDGTTVALLKVIEGLGYAVMVSLDGRQITAIHSTAGERIACTGEDPCIAACKVAQLVGVELDDG